MHIRRTHDGKTWTDVSTKLKWLDWLLCDATWPPEPIDVLWIKLDEKHIEMCVSDAFTKPGSDGRSSWIASYLPEIKRWKIVKAEKAQLEGRLGQG